MVGSEALLFPGLLSAVTPGVTCAVFVTVPGAEVAATTSEIVGAEELATIVEG